MHRTTAIFLSAALLQAAFFVISVHLDKESIWYDEGWTMWAIRDVAPVWDVAPRDTATGLIQNVSETVKRVRGDVHPPFYFLLLDDWSLLTGQSVFATRLLSAFAGMIALATAYRMSTDLFACQTGLITLALLGTASFQVYYARELRMYSLVLALGLLSMWAFLHWLRRPSWRSGLLHTLLLIALIYTHYATVTIFAVQVVILLLDFKTLALKRFVPYVVAGLSFVPWLPTLLSQLRANPDGPLAFPVPTDLHNLLDLGRILSGGAWHIYLPAVIIGLYLLRRQQFQIRFLGLWLVLPPAILFVLNATVIEIYQVRYIILILPAWVMLAAYAVSRLDWRVSTGIVIVVVGVQLISYTPIWGHKPDWKGQALDYIDNHPLTEPAVTHIAAESVLGYYDGQYRLRRGVSLDLSWREHTLTQVDAMLASLHDTPAVWMVMPSNVSSTWYTAARLSDDYVPTYAKNVLNVLFYRFERSTGDGLHFRFGDVVRYDDDPMITYTTQPGTSLCIDPIQFTALRDLNDDFSVGIHLAQDHQAPISQWDGGLGLYEQDTSFELAECLDIPADAQPGNYHLRLVVYDWRMVQNEAVIADDVFWGEALIFAAVEIEGT